ncbi:MAG: hypothetical protein GY759_00025 [Chloroflexi bacterium]|nr:hypothetical protein [Chloroflexota bacterium]
MDSDYELYLRLISALANAINLLSAAMFLARVYRPGWANTWGLLAILMGVPALLLTLYGMSIDVSFLSWLMPLLYAVFAVLTLVLDYILKIEFRNPRRTAILAPFLLLFYIPLIGMWGMTWDLGLGYWIINGITYFIMLGSSFYALRRGVG